MAYKKIAVCDICGKEEELIDPVIPAMANPINNCPEGWFVIEKPTIFAWIWEHETGRVTNRNTSSANIMVCGETCLRTALAAIADEAIANRMITERNCGK